MTARTATDIVVLCEERLGFVVDPEMKGLRKARMIEAGKINRKLKKEPAITIADLELAVEYSWRKREPVTSPAALFWRVGWAKEMANEEVVLSDVSADVEAALAWEMDQDVPDPSWVGKLTRAHGAARLDVLGAWKAAGRG